MDQRLEGLRGWASAQLGGQKFDIVPASSDASFRRYFRLVLDDGRSLIGMDAPPDREDSRPFLEVATLLADTGVHVPHVHAVDLQLGYMLLDDLGSTPFLQILDASNADELYGDALGALATFQRGISSQAPLPAYDHALLMREMELFREWFVGRHLGLRLSATESAVLDRCFEHLAADVLTQPRVFVHRDYHSRNLMRTAENNPGIIDFQDAVIGPVTYDLVSLLRDAYVRWPPERVQAWALDHHRRLVSMGLIEVDSERFLRWFDWMGLQRHLKVAGIFARLSIRDGKHGFLADIPLTLDYVVEAAARYRHFADLVDLIGTHDMLARSRPQSRASSS